MKIITLSLASPIPRTVVADSAIPRNLAFDAGIMRYLPVAGQLVRLLKLDSIIEWERP
jgi:hypothetical protein